MNALDRKQAPEILIYEGNQPVEKVPRSAVLWLHSFIFILVFCAAPGGNAQTAARYAGRPFVRIVQSNISDPAAGFISGFGRAQLVNDSVVFIPQSGLSAAGVFSGRGGPLTKMIARGETISGVTLNELHTGFVRLASGR